MSYHSLFITKTKYALPIYINPTSSDFVEIYKNKKHVDIRFTTLNDEKIVYMWDGHYAIHQEVHAHLNLIDWKTDPSVFIGTATISGKKAIMSDLDRFDIFKTAQAALKTKQDEVYIINEIVAQLKVDWTWLYPYIDCKDYLVRIKNKLEGIEKVKEKL